ncbi:MAG: RDD family protein [Treponema sp.]|jgi:uncharacterized RDD family membrane protein YckC|nr:RDD family protein [Treponema sp.]
MAPEKTDTSISVETPEGILYSLYPAGPLIRACAYGIDVICQWVLILGFSIAYRVILEEAAGIWVLLLVQFVMNWFYQALWEYFGGGQTPGKRLLGIRVVMENGSPLSPGAALMRNLLSFADTFLGLYLIAFVSMAASDGFRRLGDWAAGTLVIHTWKSRAPERRESLDWLAKLVPVNAGQLLSYEEKQGILMFARRYAHLGPARAGEIARVLAEALGFTERPDAEAADYAKAAAGEVSAANSPAAAGTGAAAYLLGMARNFAGIQ